MSVVEETAVALPGAPRVSSSTVMLPVLGAASTGSRSGLPSRVPRSRDLPTEYSPTTPMVTGASSREASSPARVWTRSRDAWASGVSGTSCSLSMVRVCWAKSRRSERLRLFVVEVTAVHTPSGPSGCPAAGLLRGVRSGQQEEELDPRGAGGDGRTAVVVAADDLLRVRGKNRGAACGSWRATAVAYSSLRPVSTEPPEVRTVPKTITKAAVRPS